MFCQKNQNLRTKKIAPLFLENSTLNTNFDQKQKVFFVLPFIALLWSNWQGISERCDGLAIGKRTHHRGANESFLANQVHLCSGNHFKLQYYFQSRRYCSQTLTPNLFYSMALNLGFQKLFCQSLLIKRHWELLFQWWIKMFGIDSMWFVQP